MRPRHRCRGEQRLATMKARYPNGFNAATASMPWRTMTWPPTSCAPASFNAATASMPWRTMDSPEYRRYLAALQCGHGIDAVENPAGEYDVEVKVDASMRPRHRCRGERRKCGLWDWSD